MKIDSRYLPSKRFTYSVLVMITLIVIALFVNFSRTKIAEYKIAEIQKKNSEELSLREQFLQTDTDGDGMKDWEEALWGTDPKMADTDGDGTSDGAEATANRNPLVKGPDDKIDPKVIAEEQRITEEYNQLNATEKLSRDLFSQYIATKNTSTEITDADAQQILQTALSAEKQVTFSSYATSDLNISSKTGNEDIKQWINRIGEISANNTNKSGRTEVIILQEATETQEDTALKELDIIVDGYERITSELLAMPVPESVSATHLKLLNSIATIAQSVDNMKLLFSDTVTAITSISVYQTASNSLYESVLDITNISKYLDLSFEQNSYGYVFINMI